MSSRQGNNTISGKIILKESGKGIPDLLVVIYDLDPATKPEEDFGNSNPSVDPLQPRPFPVLGDRLGSVLSSRDGTFLLNYEDVEYRTQNVTEKRPDLLLLVLAPEDADSNAPPTILFSSKSLRQNSGRLEAYIIRISSEQLLKAGIKSPNEEKESPESRIQHYINEKNSKIALNDGIAKYNKTIIGNHLVEKENFKNKFKAQVAMDVNTYAGNGVFVKDGESILEKTTEIFKTGIENANDLLGPSTHGVPVNLYFTPEDRQNLKAFFDAAVNGIAEIPEEFIRPLLFKVSSSENIGTLLVNNNPIAKYCMDRTAEEACAIQHLGNSTDHHPDNGDGNGNATGSNVVTITNTDIPTYVARLINEMPSPDSVLNPDQIPSRPNQEVITKSIESFSLQKGAAETAAYYDFHSLQIAFEYVWQQLFDQDMINSGYNLHQQLLNQTGINSIAANSISFASFKALADIAINTPLAEVPANISAHFDITKEEWNDVNKISQDKLEDIAQKLDAGLEATVRIFGTEFKATIDAFTREKYYQNLTEQGERLIDSVRHDDYYTMHKTLRDLHDRLYSKYEYTVFAADNNHYSVNFGILNTFRQEWLPLSYQVGKLCKSIPLAPKEERKYSFKITKHVKRNEKEARKNNTSFTAEQTSTSRSEGEIISKAQNKTNFNLTTEGTYNIGISKGDAKTSLGVEAQNEAQQTRKDFREAVLKATQEYKDERSTEIDTEVTNDSEYNDSGTIVNPNDELAVTYLFYELQRRYRISEQLYRVLPVVLVAQPVPSPDEITEAWVIAQDWILNRFLLDDSFKPCLVYLANKSVGDDFALRELRRNLRHQRNLVGQLENEFAAASSDAENKYKALLQKIQERINEEEEADDEGFFTNVAAFFGSNDANPDIAKARELAASDEHKYAVEKAEKIGVALRGEMDTLHKLTAEYNNTLREHLDNETRVKRLLVHIRNNIIYYMQAIWSMEPPDQRFLRLQKVQVPDLKLDNNGRIYKVQVEPSEDLFAMFRPEGTEKHKATMSGNLAYPFKYKPLIELADLDKPLGFKGNYIIFPMKEHNALTEFMAAPYIDAAFGAMDPNEFDNLNLNDFSKYICCLHDRDPDMFEQLKPMLNKWFGQLLADPLRNGDELIIPSGSLYIEALPAAHPLLEDFKLKHRELDVFKVQAEVRKMELENVRYAARLLDQEHEDPDIEKKIVVNGNGISSNIDLEH